MLGDSTGDTIITSGVYLILKMQYQHASGWNPHSSWTDLEKVSGDYAAMYQKEDPSTPD